MKTKLFFGIFLSILLIVGCTNSEESVIYNDEVSALTFVEQTLNLPKEPVTDVAMLKQYEEVMVEVLKMAKGKDFRGFVFDEALLQIDGDYDVFVDKIVDSYKNNDGFKKSTSNLALLSTNLKIANNGLRPVVFYPRAETLEKNIKIDKSFNAKAGIEEPVVVFRGPYNDDYSVPGYNLNEDGELVFNRMVTEEDAWQNDVYVVGPEEGIVTPNYVEPIDPDPWGGGGGGGGYTPTTRTDGRAEYGGLIQVTDLNAIEHWTAGKLEFRILVYGVQNSSATLIKDKKFDKRARDNFRDNKWYDFDEFIVYWNKSNLGNWNIEQWMERDEPSGEGETTVSYKDENNATYSIKIKVNNADDDLGRSIVQFTDPLSTVYGISHMNFKRK